MAERDAEGNGDPEGFFRMHKDGHSLGATIIEDYIEQTPEAIATVLENAEVYDSFGFLVPEQFVRFRRPPDIDSIELQEQQQLKVWSSMFEAGSFLSLFRRADQLIQMLVTGVPTAWRRQVLDPFIPFFLISSLPSP